MKAKLAGFAWALAASFAATAVSAAESFPSRPIRLIVPFTPGGGTDIVARLLAKNMGATLGQSIVVENRPGANGVIGADQLAKAAPDGYTVMLTIASHAAAPALYKKLPYDTLKDFSSISLVASYPYVVVVPRDFPARSFKDFVDYAHKHPGKLAYASSGTGSGPHLGMELLKQSAGLDLLHVPYKGASAANTDLVSGQVQTMLNNFLAASALLKSGQLRALAVTSKERSAAMPDLPTVAESGYPGFEVVGWYALFGPRDMPADVQARLADAAAKAARDPAFIARLKEDGAIPVGSSPEELQKFFAAEVEKWGTVARKANITVSE